MTKVPEQYRWYDAEQVKQNPTKDYEALKDLISESIGVASFEACSLEHRKSEEALAKNTDRIYEKVLHYKKQSEDLKLTENLSEFIEKFLKNNHVTRPLVEMNEFLSKNNHGKISMVDIARMKLLNEKHTNTIDNAIQYLFKEILHLHHKDNSHTVIDFDHKKVSTVDVEKLKKIQPEYTILYNKKTHKYENYQAGKLISAKDYELIILNLDIASEKFTIDDNILHFKNKEFVLTDGKINLSVLQELMTIVQVDAQCSQLYNVSSDNIHETINGNTKDLINKIFLQGSNKIELKNGQVIDILKFEQPIYNAEGSKIIGWEEKPIDFSQITIHNYSHYCVDLSDDLYDVLRKNNFETENTLAGDIMSMYEHSIAALCTPKIPEYLIDITQDKINFLEKAKNYPNEYKHETVKAVIQSFLDYDHRDPPTLEEIFNKLAGKPVRNHVLTESAFLYQSAKMNNSRAVIGDVKSLSNLNRTTAARARFENKNISSYQAGQKIHHKVTRAMMESAVEFSNQDKNNKTTARGDEVTGITPEKIKNCSALNLEQVFQNIFAKKKMNLRLVTAAGNGQELGEKGMAQQLSRITALTEIKKKYRNLMKVLSGQLLVLKDKPLNEMQTKDVLYLLKNFTLFDYNNTAWIAIKNNGVSIQSNLISDQIQELINPDIVAQEGQINLLLELFSTGEALLNFVRSNQLFLALTHNQEYHQHIFKNGKFDPNFRPKFSQKNTQLTESQTA